MGDQNPSYQFDRSANWKGKSKRHLGVIVGCVVGNRERSEFMKTHINGIGEPVVGNLNEWCGRGSKHEY